MAQVLMYGVELESRCLANVPAAEERPTFLVGTQNMKVTNQICEVYQEGNRIVARNLPHTAGEIRALCSDPGDATRAITASSDYTHITPIHSFNLYRLGENELEELAKISVESEVYSVQWQSERNRVVALHSNKVSVFDMERPWSLEWENCVQGTCSMATWSPHDRGNTVGVAMDRNIVTFDMRTKDEAHRIREAHSLRCLYVDFNPNQQHIVVSCGRDGLLRIWDWRQPSSSLLSFRAHAHWATQVHYHPVHDELILSCGTDASLVLTSGHSVSSDANEEEEEGQDRTILHDGLLERIDEHEESIYACAWSTADPWTFASLSFDGRILISHVNREHKYALMRL